MSFFWETRLTLSYIMKALDLSLILVERKMLGVLPCFECNWNRREIRLSHSGAPAESVIMKSWWKDCCLVWIWHMMHCINAESLHTTSCVTHQCRVAAHTAKHSLGPSSCQITHRWRAAACHVTWSNHHAAQLPCFPCPATMIATLLMLASLLTLPSSLLLLVSPLEATLPLMWPTSMPTQLLSLAP